MAKAVVIIPKSAPETIEKLSIPMQNKTIWVDKMKSQEVLQQAEGYLLKRFQIKSKWPSDDRELLFVQTTKI